MSILDWVSSHKGLNWDMLLMRRQIVFWGNAGLDQDIIQWHQFLHPAGTSCIVSPHETGSEHMAQQRMLGPQTTLMKSCF